MGAGTSPATTLAPDGPLTDPSARFVMLLPLTLNEVATVSPGSVRPAAPSGRC